MNERIVSGFLLHEDGEKIGARETLYLHMLEVGSAELTFPDDEPGKANLVSFDVLDWEQAAHLFFQAIQTVRNRTNPPLILETAVDDDRLATCFRMFSPQSLAFEQVVGQSTQCVPLEEDLTGVIAKLAASRLINRTAAWPGQPEVVLITAQI